MHTPPFKNQHTFTSLLLAVMLTTALLLAAIPFRGSMIGVLLLAGVGAIILAAVVLLKPEFGVYVLILTIFSNVSALLSYRGYPGINKALLLLVFLSVVTGRLLRGKAALKMPAAIGWLLSYGVILFLSALIATDRATALTQALDFAKDFLIIITIVNALKTRQAWKRAIWMVIIAATFLAVLGVIQVVSGHYGWQFGGLAQVDAGIVGYDVFAARLTGPLGDPNFYGQVLLPALALALYRILPRRRGFHTASARQERDLEIAAAIIALGCVFILAMALMNTFSRGAFVGLVAAALLMAWERRFRWQLWVLMAGVGLIGYLIMPAGYRQRLSTLTLFSSGQSKSLNEASFRGRQSEVMSGLLMFSEHPLLGVGGGNYLLNYQHYAARVGLEHRSEARNAHSLYIETAAETGVLGIVAFAGIFYTTLSRLWQHRKKYLAIDPDWAAWLAAIFVAICAYLTTSLFLHGDFIRYLWVLVALAAAAISLSEKEIVA